MTDTRGLLADIVAGNFSESYSALRVHLRQSCPGAWWFLMRGKTGDLLYGAAVAAAFRRRLIDLGVSNEIALVCSARDASVVSLFEDEVDKIVVTNHSPPRLACHERFAAFCPETAVVIHPDFLANYASGMIRVPEAPYPIGRRVFDFAERLKLSFGLPVTEPLRIPGPSREALGKAEQRLSELGMHGGKTVLLAPRSKALNMISVSFWHALVESLSSLGYGCIENLGPGEQPLLPQVPSVQLKHEMTMALAQVAGAVVSMRSGLCDILATLPTKQVVLYPVDAPHDEKKKDYWTVRRHFPTASVVELGVSRQGSSMDMVSKLSALVSSESFSDQLANHLSP